MADETREIKVGLFVFIALVLLSVVIFSISDFYTAQPHYPLRFRFGFAGGIEVGAPVRLAGVDVGEVRSVEILRDMAAEKMYAEIGAALSPKAKVEEDAVAYINTLGLIGEKYLEIIPGSSGARRLGPGEVLRGKDSVPSEQVMESGYQVLKKLEEAVASFNEVVQDESAKSAVQNLDELLRQANDILRKIRLGEGTLGRLMAEDDIYRDLQALAADLRAHPWKLLHRPKESKAR